MTNQIQLQNIVNVNELAKVLNSFVLSTGLKAVFVDTKGNSTFIPDASQDYCTFCKIIRSDPEGLERCTLSMMKAGKLASQLGEPYISHCHAGVIEFAAPILFNDIHLGSIFSGPVLMWEWDELAVQEFQRRTQDLRIDREALLVASRNIKILSGRNVQAAADLLFITANYIAKNSMVTLKQRKELNEQQARLAEVVFDKKKTEDIINVLKTKTKKSRYPMDKEYDLLSRVRLGDRSGAKEILNEILGDIFFHDTGNTELLKARVLELLVVISRAAVEGGASLDKLLGLNYEFIGELAGKKEYNDICLWIIKVLDIFIDTVYETRNIKNAKIVGESLNYIHQNFHLNLSLENVAQQVYISPYYLSHLFKEELGITFVEYLTKVRIEEAKKLLKTTSLSIVAIASEVGYEDASYFSKVFKKNMGISPNQFRKNV